ncbi:MAG: hypothetical protein M1834_001121 [Cirrosporium novae-zelandiae]|nr:MAG: hypothetical protein M1834_001121 [Cirrosporium novae-zelandiae]
MLLTPRTYILSQVPDDGAREARPLYSAASRNRSLELAAERRARRMLLVHQVGDVGVGEVVRNTCAIALRAAYLHGPYTLYAACYPATFNPNQKQENSQQEGVPEFEPQLKAGGSWEAKLTVPENIRSTADTIDAHFEDGPPKSFSWKIEIASQVIFSTSACVKYELLVGRDERSVDLGLSAFTGNTHGTPGDVRDHEMGKPSGSPHKGIFSRAVTLMVQDTTSLWNTPPFPEWENTEDRKSREGITRKSFGRRSQSYSEEADERKQKKVHLVILTHGLHSNLGADMLYVKESIDAAAKQAKEDVRKRRAQYKLQERQRKANSFKQSTENKQPLNEGTSQSSLDPELDNIADEDEEEDEDEDEEEVVVRGFSGNACRTEKGIQYLGKRLAKYVLMTTYPDQPYYPVKTSMAKSISRTFAGQKPPEDNEGQPVHEHSSIHHYHLGAKKRAYQITSISFIAHSLGGLIQTYAIAYIQKHSPQFFQKIKPINFVAMASPFLGLSNENPMYVKFALDFGLIAQTGRDLGLSWRGSAAVRSGLGAMIAGLGNEALRTRHQQDPGSKPLLRILPTGPAHTVLRLFRNRTVYSNVVNDGIVPLRTSCLLFLDWRGLGRVEKARRENGLIGTIAEWGFAEVMGTNASAQRSNRALEEVVKSDDNSDDSDNNKTSVPQPPANAAQEDNTSQVHRASHSVERQSPLQEQTNPFSGFFSLFKPSPPRTPSQNSHQNSPKQSKIYKRSQTLSFNDISQTSDVESQQPSSRPGMARGDSLYGEDVLAPPRTTFFESAGDLLAPPLPPTSFLIDPESRPRTIFHDRVYHPEDIPPSAPSRRTLTRSISANSIARNSTNQSLGSNNAGVSPTSGMKVEEKIARAYHHDLSWRKVLVRLEPDAHNNMIVRRMFANAYGWPVIKHMVDTHFADTVAARTDDDLETNTERAKPMDEPTGVHGEEVEGQKRNPHSRTDSELREAVDEVRELRSTPQSSWTGTGTIRSSRGDSRPSTSDSSGRWTDGFFAEEDEDDDEFLASPPSLSRSVSAIDMENTEDDTYTSGRSQSQPPSKTNKYVNIEFADTLTSSPAEEMLKGPLELWQEDQDDDPAKTPMGTATPIASSSHGPQPQDLHHVKSAATNLVGVGLGVPPEERIAASSTSHPDVPQSQSTNDEHMDASQDKGKGKGKGTGFVEQVARLSFGPCAEMQSPGP